MQASHRPSSVLRSGERAPATGLYVSGNHSHEGFRLEVLLIAGDRIPICVHCGEEIWWIFAGRPSERIFDKEELARSLENTLFVS